MVRRQLNWTSALADFFFYKNNQLLRKKKESKKSLLIGHGLNQGMLSIIGKVVFHYPVSGGLSDSFLVC